MKTAWACPHTDRKHMCRGLCGPCYDAARYLENRDTIRESKRLDRINNLRKYKIRAKSYRAKNIEKVRAYGREYYAKNREKLRANSLPRAKEYYQAHKEQIAEYGRKRRRELGDELKLRKIEQDYGITRNTLFKIFEKQVNTCPCGSSFGERFPKGRRRLWNIDHDHDCCSGFRSCGKCVRGLLCCRCNQVLGLLDEDPRLLPQYMLEYLKGYQNVRAASAN